MFWLIMHYIRQNFKIYNNPIHTLHIIYLGLYVFSFFKILPYVARWSTVWSLFLIKKSHFLVQSMTFIITHLKIYLESKFKWIFITSLQYLCFLCPKLVSIFNFKERRLEKGKIIQEILQIKKILLLVF